MQYCKGQCTQTITRIATKIQLHPKTFYSLANHAYTIPRGLKLVFFCPVSRAQAEMQPICKVNSRQKVVIAKNLVWKNNMDGGKKSYTKNIFSTWKCNFWMTFFFPIHFIYNPRLCIRYKNITSSGKITFLQNWCVYMVFPLQLKLM